MEPKNKYSINLEKILPIVLSLFLSGFNLFSETAEDLFGNYSFRWLSVAIVLYVLWVILDRTSQVQTKHKNLFVTLVVIVAVAIIYLLFTFFVFKEQYEIKWKVINKLISVAILFLIIQYILRTRKNLNQITLEKEQIQSENYKAQLQELRLKVDPHFLFNSLNTLRTMIRNGNNQAEEFVMNLSGFYRQTLSLNSESTISLKDEIEALKSYLSLMKIRNEGKVNTSINIQEDWIHYQIPTLSLQIIVENCFKHNRVSTTQPLQIEISTEEGGYLSIKNNLNLKLSKTENSGYGLKNIEKRYELLGVKNGIITQKTDKYFEVKLKLIYGYECIDNRR
ncbi:MAG: sensor histidine kinase [Alphaproteobacteria bacterium]